MSIHELQEYTRIARYARYNEDKGRRETWVEQVNRVMDMHEVRYASHLDDIEEEMQIAYNALKKKLVLGSQRALQFGGPSILRKNARMYNCLDVNTEFITSNGVKSFNDFKDGENVSVLTHEGNWKDAIVKNYGVDELNEIIFINDNSDTQTVYATNDHTWILDDGSRTESLKEGDRLFKFPSDDVIDISIMVGWTVHKIKKNVKEEPVWCLEVEDDHSFVLPNGIVTGNCTVSYADRPRFFQEAMYLLLCGCGVGFSVQSHHVKKLPTLKLPEDDAETVLYQIPDSIEGWSDAIGVILSSYFKTKQTMPEYFGKKIEFDFSLIRPEGSLIADTNGKAPGPEPLKKAINHIQNVVKRASDEANKTDGFRLRSVDVYDIVMHSSDAVLAGGVRRSATICIFSHDDDEMINAKTGDWFITNPQRGRSNNSALLVRDETTHDTFMKLMKSVREFGEPGFVWADDTEALYNPCVEIGMRAYDENGNSGWSFCNLCEINVKKAKTAEDFYEMCRAAAILGTLQAGYASFAYLGEVTENIVRREALLGCSMTGMMDNPEISFDPEIQRKGAELIKEVNEAFCKKIGVNPAARTTCVKPAGSTSCILGTASGIHPHHAKRYFRRVQVNKLEEPLKFFRQYNPDAIGESVWSANNSDDVITFLCEVPKSARTKVDVDAIQLLDYVRSTQQNWVEHGTNHKYCVAPWLRHNVSNTINVKEHEWDDVAEYIYENRKYFAGISLLPMSGDKDYAQAPFQTVYTPKELVEMYGDASVFASGLIIHALKAFGGNLYRACDTVLGIGEQIQTTIKLEREIDLTKSSDEDIYDMKQQIGNEMSKLKWLQRAKKFADNYFDGDLRKATYCLKDVDAWKTWVDLKRVYQNVPWDEFFEGIDNTKVSETVACAGGQCTITSM